jgi:hypothetical protein
MEISFYSGISAKTPGVLLAHHDIDAAARAA